MFLPVVKPVVRTVLRVASLVLFLLTLLSAYGGYANPEYFGIPGVMVMLLPYFAIATAVVSLLWFVTGGWITGAIGAGTLAFAWLPVTSAFPLGFERNPTAGRETFTLLSWNFLHSWDQAFMGTHAELSGDQPDNKSMQFIIDNGSDIVCLQELDAINSGEIPHLDKYRDKLDKAYPYKSYEPGKDTWVLSKYPVRNLPVREFVKERLGGIPDYIQNIKGVDAMKYFSFHEVAMPRHKLLVVNVHLSSPGLSDAEREVVTDIKSMQTAKESAREFKNTILGKIRKSLYMHKYQALLICEALSSYDGPVIICGDFNDVPQSYSWREFQKGGFRDAYGEVGFGPMVTYNKHAFWLHLDQIMYRGDLRPLKVVKEKIKTSDHYPVKAWFEFTPAEEK